MEIVKQRHYLLNSLKQAKAETQSSVKGLSGFTFLFAHFS